MAELMPDGFSWPTSLSLSLSLSCFFLFFGSVAGPLGIVPYLRIVLTLHEHNKQYKLEKAETYF